MLDLTKQESFKKLIFDSATGAEVVLEHRLPTTAEEIEFHRKTFRKREKKNISPEDIAKNLAEIRLDFGMRILTGFREGDFGQAGQAISANPSHPQFNPGWKELIRDQAPRIISALATAVFEGSKTVALSDEEGEEEGEVPFPKS